MILTIELSLFYMKGVWEEGAVGTRQHILINDHPYSLM